MEQSGAWPPHLTFNKLSSSVNLQSHVFHVKVISDQKTTIYYLKYKYVLKYLFLDFASIVFSFVEFLFFLKKTKLFSIERQKEAENSRRLKNNFPFPNSYPVESAIKKIISLHMKFKLVFIPDFKYLYTGNKGTYIENPNPCFQFSDLRFPLNSRIADLKS